MRVRCHRVLQTATVEFSTFENYLKRRLTGKVVYSFNLSFIDITGGSDINKPSGELVTTLWWLLSHPKMV